MDHRRNQVPVAEGPFKVAKMEENYETIEQTDQFVENVSISCVFPAPKEEEEKISE